MTSAVDDGPLSWRWHGSVTTAGPEPVGCAIAYCPDVERGSAPVEPSPTGRVSPPAIGVLGPLEVRVDGVPVAIRRGRPRRLLLALVVRAGEPVGAEALVDQLWDEDVPQNAGNALQVLVSYLRRTLRPADGEGPGEAGGCPSPSRRSTPATGS